MFTVKTFDVDFGKEEIVLNTKDALDLGVRTQDRVKITSKKISTVALVNTTERLVEHGEIGIYHTILKKTGLKDGEEVKVVPIEKPVSVEYIKRKLKGGKLGKIEIDAIVEDTVSNSLSLIDLTAFISALQINGMDIEEVEFLTKAMAGKGDRLKFSQKTYDKHSLGGVPGDKTTLLVVPIVAAAGLMIPKTSSRAITDPAGTADRMEVFAPVSHDLKTIKRIVEKIGACIVWGGALNLAPADDSFIQIEYPLSIDPRPLLLASIMSKKKAVSSDFVVIDLPTGPGAKVPDAESARRLAREFIDLGERLGMRVEGAITYGSQPVGNAMGPALEALEALKTLKGKGPNSLIEKATEISGIILEAGGAAPEGKGKEKALKILKSGKALKKFKEIIKEQGGNPNISEKDIEKKIGDYKFEVKAANDGYVTKIFNRKIAKVAKYAGAPNDKGAGVVLKYKGGEPVKKGEKIFTIYAEKKYKLEYAKKIAQELKPVKVEGMLLEEIPSSAMIGLHK